MKKKVGRHAYYFAGHMDKTDEARVAGEALL